MVSRPWREFTRQRRPEVTFGTNAIIHKRQALLDGSHQPRYQTVMGQTRPQVDQRGLNIGQFWEGEGAVEVAPGRVNELLGSVPAGLQPLRTRQACLS